MTLCGRADWVCGSAGGGYGGRGRQQGLVFGFYLFFDFFSGQFYGTVFTPSVTINQVLHYRLRVVRSAGNPTLNHDSCNGRLKHETGTGWVSYRWER